MNTEQMREALESYEHAAANGHREHDALSAFDGISVPDLVRWVLAAPQAPADAVRDAERYRWLAAHCRSTSEHWGGRWSIIVDGPAPQSHDSEDDFDAAIDAAMSTKAGGV